MPKLFYCPVNKTVPCVCHTIVYTLPLLMVYLIAKSYAAIHFEAKSEENINFPEQTISTR